MRFFHGAFVKCVILPAPRAVQRRRDVAQPRRDVELLLVVHFNLVNGPVVVHGVLVRSLHSRRLGCRLVEVHDPV